MSRKRNRRVDRDLQRRTKLVLSVLPSLKKHPNQVLALAQSPLADDDLVQGMRSSIGQVKSHATVKALRRADGGAQRDAWDKMDKTQRSILKGMGYKGPPKEEDGGFFDDLESLGGNLMDTVTGALTIPSFGLAPAIRAAVDEGDIGAAANYYKGWATDPLTPVKESFNAVGGLAAAVGDVGHMASRAPVVGSTVREATGALDTAEHWATENAIEPAFERMNQVGQFPSRLVRIGARLGEIKHGANAGWDPWNWDITTEDLGDAWELSGKADGEGQFHKGDLDKAYDELGGDKQMLRWVQTLNSGGTIEDIAAKAGTRGSKEYEQRYLEILGAQESDGFKKAMKTIAGAHVSVGRDLARGGLGLDLDSTEGTLVSGAIDAAWTYYTDPLLLAGKVSKAVKAYRWDVAGGQGVAMDETIMGARSLETQQAEKVLGSGWKKAMAEAAPKAQDAMVRQLARGGASREAMSQRIAVSFQRFNEATDAGAGLWRAETPIADLALGHNRLKRAIPSFVDYNKKLIAERGRGIDSADDIWDFWESADGIKALSSGQVARRTIEHIELPRLSRKGYELARAKGIVQTAFSKLDDHVLNRIGVLDEGMILDKSGKATEAVEMLPDIATGNRRLFRVSAVSGGNPNVPGYMKEAQLAGNLPDEAHWFTDDLEVARASSENIGPSALLSYVDVPEAQVTGRRLADLFTPLTGGRVPMDREREFALDKLPNGLTEIGTIGDYAEFSKGVGTNPFRTLLATPIKFWRSMSTNVPESGLLKLHGPDSIVQFERFVDMSMAGAPKKMYMEAMVAATNAGEGRTVIRAAMDRMFMVNGVYETEQGRQIAAKYLDGVKQRYAPNGIDMMAQGTGHFPQAIYPFADHADGIAIPQFRQVLDTSREVSLSRSLSGPINNEFVDSFMGRYWRPSVLLRLGFAPRVAGEEILAAVLRSPGIVKDSLLLPVAGKDPAGLEHRVAVASDWMSMHIPEAIDNAPWTERLAHFMDNKHMGWVRGMAERSVDPEKLAFYRAAAKNPIAQRTHASELTHATGSGYYGTEELLDPDSQAGIVRYIEMDEKGTRARFQSLPSEMSEIGMEQPEFMGIYSMRVRHAVGRAGNGLVETAGRDNMAALATYMHPSQLHAVEDRLIGTAARLESSGDELSARLIHGLTDERSASEVVGEIRRSVNLSPSYRGMLEQHAEAVLAGDTQRAAKIVTELKTYAKKAPDYVRPGLVAHAELFPEISPDLRHALMAQEDTLIDTLGAEARSSRGDEWRRLITESRSGDAYARDRLAEEMTLRNLQHPDAAKVVRDHVRSNSDRWGNRVFTKIPEGQQYVYVINIPGRDADIIAEALGAVDLSPSTKRFLQQRIGNEAQTAAEMNSLDDTIRIPMSSWATSDVTEAKAVRDEINHALGRYGRQDLADIGVAGVSDDQIRAFHNANPDAGTYHYTLTNGEGYNSRSLEGSTVTAANGQELPGIELEDALRDWAKVMTDSNKDLVLSSKTGRVLHEVAEPAVRKGHYDISMAKRYGMSPDELPRSVIAPGKFLRNEAFWDRFVRWGFDKAINPIIAAMARKPIFNYEAARAFTGAQHLRKFYEDPDALRTAVAVADRVSGGRVTDLRLAWDKLDDLPQNLRWIKKKSEWGDANIQRALTDLGIPESFRTMDAEDVAAVRKWANNQDYVDQQIFETAFMGALDNTMPFVHDHHVRTQFSDGARNLLPFWFAEEQFFKRWTRTLARSPEALRRGQLYYMGLRHVGFIRENDQGEDVFVYPGSAQLTSLLADTAEMVTGDKYNLPIEVALTGQTQMSVPALAQSGGPGFSPIVGIPMAALANRFPELESIQSNMMGELAVGKGPLEQLMPTIVQRAWRVIQGSGDRDEQYASAMIQAMQYLDAHNKTPDDTASDAKKEHYLDNVENYTRILLLSRTILGFAGVAPPQAEFPGHELNTEFKTLLHNVPLEDAVGVFLERHPNATAYTVFTTTSESGASMETTKQVGDFLSDNADFVGKYRMATPWLLPQSNADDTGERYVFDMQMRMELRHRKSPQEWVEDLYFNKGADPYFKNYDEYQKLKGESMDKTRDKVLDEAWRGWKDQFFKQHPLFATQLQSREGHTRRIEVIGETGKALQDRDLPVEQIPHLSELREVMHNWDTVDSEITSLRGDRTAKATQRRKILKRAFYLWARDFTENNPATRAFFQRNLIPELDLDSYEREQLDEAA